VSGRLYSQGPLVLVPACLVSRRLVLLAQRCSPLPGSVHVILETRLLLLLTFGFALVFTLVFVPACLEPRLLLLLAFGTALCITIW